MSQTTINVRECQAGSAEELRQELWRLFQSTEGFEFVKIIQSRKDFIDDMEDAEVAGEMYRVVRGAEKWAQKNLGVKAADRVHEDNEREVCEVLSVAAKEMVASERDPRRAAGDYVLRLGRHKKKRLGEVSVDYLTGLLKMEGLWLETRRAIEVWLEYLKENPDMAKLPFAEWSYVERRSGWTRRFNKMGGKHLGDLTNHQICYLAEEFDWNDPEALLPELVRKEYYCRLRWDKEAGAWMMPRIDDWEPYDSRGFRPMEGLGGQPGKFPSLWYLGRDGVDAATDERISQDLRLEVPAKGRLKMDRWKVYRGTLKCLKVMEDDEPEVAAEKDNQRSEIWWWDRVMELMDEMGFAATEEDLEVTGLRIGKFFHSRGARKKVVAWMREVYAERREVIRAKEELMSESSRREEAIKSTTHKRRLDGAEPKPEAPITEAVAIEAYVATASPACDEAWEESLRVAAAQR